MKTSIVLVETLFAAFLATGSMAFAQQKESPASPYLDLSEPQHVLPEAQEWEGKEFPHTLSVLELNRDGFRYWGWYGLNEGMGIGLARSNDLVHWTKYEKNPLWTNARWPSVLEKADPKDPELFYFAIVRDYDTPSSHIVLATSRDGIHLKEKKILVRGVPNQRNQNPNLFRDPVSGRFFLTYYRGNDKDQFEIVSRNAAAVSIWIRLRRKFLFALRKRLLHPRFSMSSQQERIPGSITWPRKSIRTVTQMIRRENGK